VNRTTVLTGGARTGALPALIAARRAAADQAAAQPKRKRKPARKTRTDPVPVIVASAQEIRGLDELRQLGDQLRADERRAQLVPAVSAKVARRRRELAGLSSLMSSAPRPR